ncbi:MAG: hypothetical protein R3Y43_02715 [Alphaproteobacteria bacterium]
MPEIYIFDMDGTLTPARKPMTKEFSDKFLKWFENNDIYIAIGDALKGIINVISFDDNDNCASDGIKKARAKYFSDNLVFANGGDDDD